jgi:Ca-activated chloride channel family protein
MNLLWPVSLAFLLIIPLLIAGYIWILRRRQRTTIRYSSLSLVRDALPKHAHWRRHVPFALFAAALASLVFALARPTATIEVPAGRATVVLALDVSRSMCATDIDPSRFEAAQAAALSFVESQNRNIRIGIVAFAGYAELVQPPTNDPELLEEAITSLTTGRRTAIGSAIMRSLETLEGLEPGQIAQNDGVSPTPLPKGQYQPSIIVLLTDGASNSGVQPMDAAMAAVERGIRVYTIGFGTENPGQGSAAVCGSFRFRPNEFGQGGGGGFRRGIDVGTLRRVADLTGGAYYSASSANELQRVFQSLPISLITEPEQVELSVVFTIIAAILIALAFALSFRWNPLL